MEPVQRLLRIPAPTVINFVDAVMNVVPRRR